MRHPCEGGGATNPSQAADPLSLCVRLGGAQSVSSHFNAFGSTDDLKDFLSSYLKVKEDLADLIQVGSVKFNNRDGSGNVHLQI